MEVIKPAVYLNTASVGLVSAASGEKAREFQKFSETNPSGAFFYWMENNLPNLRQKMAELVHTQPERLAFVPNFSFGLLAVIDAMKGKAGKVLLYHEDYPSLNMPFELGGFEVFYVEKEQGFEIPVAKIIEAAEKNQVEVICLSHVQFLTGFTLDVQTLGAYCKKHGITFIVDFTQSWGAADLNFETLPVDVFLSSSYKWLNGGPGSAVLCIKEDFMKKFPPRTGGFGSMTQDENGRYYVPSLASYEPGHLNPLGLLQLEAAVEDRLKTGVAAVEKHNLNLLSLLASGLSHLGYEVKGGANAEHLQTLLCFVAPQELNSALSAQGIVTTWRKGMIRVSPHFYNNEKDIETFLNAVKQFQP